MLNYIRRTRYLFIDARVSVIGNTYLECTEQIQTLQKNLENQLCAICDQALKEICEQWAELITVTTRRIVFENVGGYLCGKTFLVVCLSAPENIKFDEDRRIGSAEKQVDPLKILQHIFPCITEMQKQNQNTQYQFIETVGEKDPSVKAQLIMYFNNEFAK